MPNNITFKVVNNGPHNSPRTEVKFYGLKKLVLGDVTMSDGMWDNGTWLILNLPNGGVSNITIPVISGPEAPVKIKAVVSGWYGDHVPTNNVVEIIWDGVSVDVIHRITTGGQRRITTAGNARKPVQIPSGE